MGQLEDTLSILGDLIAFPTVSADSNLAMINYLAERLEQAGARVELFRDDSGAKAGIERLEATGNVVLVSGPDAAEAQRAEYTIDKGTIVMTGNVLLNQEGGTLASNRLEVNLTSGTAQMAGRVKTILNPDGGSN